MNDAVDWLENSPESPYRLSICSNTPSGRRRPRPPGGPEVARAMISLIKDFAGSSGTTWHHDPNRDPEDVWRRIQERQEYD